jgi:hypothetical protein
LLENHLAEIAKWPIVQQGTPDTRARNVDQAMMEASHATYLVSGTYWKQRNGIRFVAKLTRGGDFRLIANADAFVNIDILAGSNLSISPRNVIQAISDQKTFSKGKPAISQLRLDVWTDKGDKNLVIEEGQRLSIYVRTNMACYLRLIYILADGRRALIQSRGRITEDEMNQALLVKTLECAPPFGAEVLCAFARTTPFEPVETIEQGDYRILRNNLADVLNTTRGLKSIHEEVLQAEARLVITTVEKRQP